jgi:hypothetical protein
MEMLQPFPGASICEWKGTARYWGLNISSPAGQAVGWTYPTAQVPYGPISGYFSFYPVVWNAWSITSVFARNPASSMVAGSRKKSSARGKASAARRTGSEKGSISLPHKRASYRASNCEISCKAALSAISRGVSQIRMRFSAAKLRCRKPVDS